jgi:hypothetical protein
MCKLQVFEKLLAAAFLYSTCRVPGNRCRDFHPLFYDDGRLWLWTERELIEGLVTKAVLSMVNENRKRAGSIDE